MYLGDYISAPDILKDPDMMDQVEDPYVVVVPSWNNHKDVLKVMTLLHARGWETVNISFAGQYGTMVALLKNPRAKSKNAGE